MSPAPENGIPSIAKNSKRKAESDDGEPPISKRALKKKKKSKKAHSADDEIDEEQHINRAISKMNGGLLADLVARQTKRFAPNMSVLELEDRRIPGRCMESETTVECRALCIERDFVP